MFASASYSQPLPLERPSSIAQPTSTPSASPPSALAAQGVAATPLADIKVELTSPYGDPTANVADGKSEFVYDNSSPGVLTIGCSAKITPDTPENRAAVEGRLRFKVQAIGDSHNRSNYVVVRWDNPWFNYVNGASRDGKGVYSSTTGTFNATVRFQGLPINNSDFGLKTVTAEIVDTNGTTVLDDDSTNIEVFYNKRSTNHPGIDYRATAADFGDAPIPVGGHSRNWFFYWSQAMGDNTNQSTSLVARYYGAAGTGRQFGRAPAVYHYQDKYVGRYDRILIGDNAAGEDFVIEGLETRQLTTGIDTFRNTYLHEIHHAIEQSLRWTNLAFGFKRLPSDKVSGASWSFNIAPNTTSRSGRVWNHKDFDVDTDDVYDPEDENSSSPLGDLEKAAYDAEIDQNNGAIARLDWGFPGKNHKTLDEYND